MHAIPTMYAGVQFRSRLEARWAAFFDLLRWPWDYEPIDLEGYIPDFLIRAPVPFIIEVKGQAEEVKGALEKIEHSGWTGEALIVTSALNPITSQGNAGMVLGVLLESFEPDRWQTEAGLLMRNSVGLYGLSHCLGDFADRISGVWDTPSDKGCCWKIDRLEPDDAGAIALWREAGNRVQWRSPRSQGA